jgi:hypothetical protein
MSSGRNLLTMSVLFKGEKCKIISVTEGPSSYGKLGHLLKTNPESIIYSVSIKLPNGRIIEDIPFDRVQIIN